MRHPYRIREIASQAGLSEATVDRVLNRRPGVRYSTILEVRSAIEDLDRQRAQVRLGGRTFMVDVVIQAPARFTTAVRASLEAELPFLRPALIRSRFHFRETADEQEITEDLDRIIKRGSHGVVLKAPDTPAVSAAIGRLESAGIPVITFVTDLPGSPRRAYVGIDNRAAGQTAAYLVGQWLGAAPGAVLVTLSNGIFRNEEEREMGFRGAMRRADPPRTVVEIAESDGLDTQLSGLVRDALDRFPGINAVYSVGGGNVAIAAAFAAMRRDCRVFIAHDLDEDNRGLLARGRLSAVLHHDLRGDMRRACQLIMAAQLGLPGISAETSSIQVVTPYNLPSHASSPAG